MLKKGNISPFVPHLVDCVDKFVTAWKSKSQRGESESVLMSHTIFEDFCSLTLEIMGVVVFDCKMGLVDETVGVNLNSETLKVTLREHLSNLIKKFNFILMCPIHPEVMLVILKILFPSLRKSLLFVESYVDSMIKHYRIQQSNVLQETDDVALDPFLSPSTSSTDSSSSDIDASDRQYLPRRGTTIIQALIANLQQDEAEERKKPEEERRGLTRQDVVDELTMMVYAAFETTATLMSWFVLYAAQHPQVQQNLKQEMLSLGYTKETDLTADMVANLKYADAVVKETLRFSPAVPGVSREALGDDVIDGIKIRKGDVVGMAFYSIHHDKRFWNIDPDTFCPERFATLDGKLGPDAKHSPYQFGPFGTSNRACAGQQLAMLEMKTIMCRLMQQVTFYLEEGYGKDGGLKAEQRITVIPLNFHIKIVFDE